MNSSLHTRKSKGDKSIRSQSQTRSFSWQLISSWEVYSISAMSMLTWEDTELGNFILIAIIHLWNQSIENFT